jgi:hypothetical protein
MRAAIQIMTQPQLLDMDVRDNEWRSGPIWDENVWGNAVHRVVAEGISPEQAVDGDRPDQADPGGVSGDAVAGDGPVHHGACHGIVLALGLPTHRRRAATTEVCRPRFDGQPAPDRGWAQPQIRHITRSERLRRQRRRQSDTHVPKDMTD